MSKTEILTETNEEAVISRLWSTIEKLAGEAIERDGVFRIGLSGGSLIKYLAAGAEKCNTDWTKWQLFFCDERYVPEDDEDSTFGQYKKHFLAKTKLTQAQFAVANVQLALKECALDYEQQIYSRFGFPEVDRTKIPQFDLLLLGMGPDGHTCSLFPNHPLLKVDDVLIAPIDDSPKPPPKRITMTYPLINNARVCLFALSGSGKSEMVQRILVNGEQLPAALVRPTKGKLIWIFDQAAANGSN